MLNRKNMSPHLATMKLIMILDTKVPFLNGGRAIFITIYIKSNCTKILLLSHVHVGSSPIDRYVMIQNDDSVYHYKIATKEWQLIMKVQQYN